MCGIEIFGELLRYIALKTICYCFYVSVQMCAHMCLRELHTRYFPWRPPGFGDAGVEVTGSCEPPDADAGNQSHILCRAIRALNH